MLWPRGGRSPQQAEAGGHSRRRLAGRAIKPGQKAYSLRSQVADYSKCEKTALSVTPQPSPSEAKDDMITNGNRFIERMYFKVREGVVAGDVDSRSTGAPGLGVLRHSPSTGCVVRLRVPYMCPALCSTQVMAPAKSILPALMPLAGCAL